MVQKPEERLSTPFLALADLLSLCRFFFGSERPRDHLMKKLWLLGQSPLKGLGCGSAKSIEEPYRRQLDRCHLVGIYIICILQEFDRFYQLMLIEMHPLRISGQEGFHGGERQRCGEDFFLVPQAIDGANRDVPSLILNCFRDRFLQVGSCLECIRVNPAPVIACSVSEAFLS